ncbi:hypothetical protein K438DRAFT_1808733 [Mycena galopus ATCC 62051]|nr:hypothetical protein K438DRAFT_1808733 [Mycena galopus ATCC 62051]
MPFEYPEATSPRLQKLCARLRRLDQAIPELQATLERLCQERRVLRREALAYPILTLPNELTSEIFINCLSSGRVIPRARTPPLLLAQVCSKWRAIAFSVPELWNSVQPRRVSTNTIRLLELWFDRAGILPISISLNSQLLPPGFHSWASSHSHKWEHVSLVLSDVELTGLRWMKVSALKTLVIGRADSVSQLIATVESFKMAPQLREVTLLRGLGPSIIELPWGQLTTLSGTDFTVRECVDVLRSAPQLMHCTFNIRSDAAGYTMQRKLKHSGLRQLTLQYGKGHIDLLRRLELPSLTRIQLSLERSTENVTSFVEFGAQSPLLQHLSVDAEALPSDQSLRCLNATPAVTILDLHSFHLATAKIWRALTLEDTRICLPALTHLRMTDEGMHLDAAAFVALVGMLRSRNGPSRDQGGRQVAKLKGFSLLLLAHSSNPSTLKKSQVDDLRTMDIDICIETRKEQLYPPDAVGRGYKFRGV